MNLTIEIPEEQAARFQKQAEAQGLTIEGWILELVERHAPATSETSAPKATLNDIFAKVRGLADDLDFSREPSVGRDVVL